MLLCTTHLRAAISSSTCSGPWKYRYNEVFVYWSDMLRCLTKNMIVLRRTKRLWNNQVSQMKWSSNSRCSRSACQRLLFISNTGNSVWMTGTDKIWLIPAPWRACIYSQHAHQFGSWEAVNTDSTGDLWPALCWYISSVTKWVRLELEAHCPASILGPWSFPLTILCIIMQACCLWINTLNIFEAHYVQGHCWPIPTNTWDT